ncbi:MAG: DUF3238 domain-containing protein, partial [Paraburkholderia sp.]|nr:DUF3238 domain-containing protein [Paraburkholderia sp.]
YALVIRRYAPFQQFGFGFEGDARTAASTALDATARTIGVVAFGADFLRPYPGGSSGTSFTGLGARFRNLVGTRTSNVVLTLTRPVVGGAGVQFTAHTSGANPLVPHAPAIDTYVDFAARFQSGTVEFAGRVRGNNFPNAEVFVVDSKGNSVLLCDFRTSGRRNLGPTTRLFGQGEASTLGMFKRSAGVNSRGFTG